MAAMRASRDMLNMLLYSGIYPEIGKQHVQVRVQILITCIFLNQTLAESTGLLCLTTTSGVNLLCLIKVVNPEPAGGGPPMDRRAFLQPAADESRLDSGGGAETAATLCVVRPSPARQTK